MSWSHSNWSWVESWGNLGEDWRSHWHWLALQFEDVVLCGLLSSQEHERLDDGLFELHELVSREQEFCDAGRVENVVDRGRFFSLDDKDGWSPRYCCWSRGQLGPDGLRFFFSFERLADWVWLRRMEHTLVVEWEGEWLGGDFWFNGNWGSLSHCWFTGWLFCDWRFFWNGFHWVDVVFGHDSEVGNVLFHWDFSVESEIGGED